MYPGDLTMRSLVTPEQLKQLLDRVPRLTTADREGLQALLSDGPLLTDLRCDLAELLADYVGRIGEVNPYADAHVVATRTPNPDWQPKSQNELVRYWHNKYYDMHVVVPKALRHVEGYTLGILPKYKFLKRQFRLDPTKDTEFPALLRQVLARLREQRPVDTHLEENDWYWNHYWWINDRAMRARKALEDSTPGDAMFVLYDMGMLTAGRGVSSVEWDSHRRRVDWLYGVGTPIDALHLLMADGGNLQHDGDLQVRPSWMRFKTGGGWSSMVLGIDENQLFFDKPLGSDYQKSDSCTLIAIPAAA